MAIPADPWSPEAPPTAASRRNHEEFKMSWKAPQIVEMQVGMEINMYACAARGLASSAGTQPRGQRVIA